MPRSYRSGDDLCRRSLSRRVGRQEKSTGLPVSLFGAGMPDVPVGFDIGRLWETRIFPTREVTSIEGCDEQKGEKF